MALGTRPASYIREMHRSPAGKSRSRKAWISSRSGTGKTRQVAADKPSLRQAGIEVFQNEPRFRGGRARDRSDPAGPPHPAEIDHERMQTRARTAHEARAASPGDYREARGLGEARDGRDIFGGPGPHDRGG